MDQLSKELEREETRRDERDELVNSLKMVIYHAYYGGVGAPQDIAEWSASARPMLVSRLWDSIRKNVMPK